MTTTQSVPKAALKLKDRVDVMADLVACDVSIALLESEWKLIEHAFDELRPALEKKVSEG